MNQNASQPTTAQSGYGSPCIVRLTGERRRLTAPLTGEEYEAEEWEDATTGTRWWNPVQENVAVIETGQPTTPLRLRVRGLPRDLRLVVVRNPRRRASFVPLKWWLSTKGRIGRSVP